MRVRSAQKKGEAEASPSGSVDDAASAALVRDSSGGIAKVGMPNRVPLPDGGFQCAAELQI